jgi:hypothetical protein
MSAMRFSTILPDLLDYFQAVDRPSAIYKYILIKLNLIVFSSSNNRNGFTNVKLRQAMIDARVRNNFIF